MIPHAGGRPLPAIEARPRREKLLADLSKRIPVPACSRVSRECVAHRPIRFARVATLPCGTMAGGGPLWPTGARSDSPGDSGSVA